MTSLLDRPAPGAGAPDPLDPALTPVPAGMLAAAQSAGASLVAIGAPVVFAWAVTSGDRASWTATTRLAVNAWLLAHHAGIAIPGGHLGIVPLGLLLVPLVTCWLGGVRLARALDPQAGAVRVGATRARPVVPPPRAIAALVGSYAGLVTLASAAVATSEARPLAAQALVGAFVIALLGAVTGVAAWRAGGVVAGLRFLLRWARIPPAPADWVRPAVTVVAVHLAAGLVMFGIALVAGWDRVLILHRALDPGVAGGIVLVLAQVALVPNAVVWAAAYVAGPGFAIGTATSVTPGGTVLGPLPAVPLLGGLPSPGEHSVWWWGLLAIPVVAGLAGGVRIVRTAPRAPGKQWLVDAGGTALYAGVALGALGWLSGGPAGPGRLAQVGPSGWQVGLAVAAEVAAGTFTTAGLAIVLRRVRPPAREPADVGD
jgi:hypothetical protein